MSVIGLVCEYNPYHNGHKYQLERIRELYGNDCIIVCVMSGDFVQRGEAAVFSKYARAESACLCGADIVAELPLPWALSSAEGFARGAVSILSGMGIERLCFGTETEDIAALERIAELVCGDDVKEQIKSVLKAEPATSYAAARQKALESRIGSAAELIERPNNILAVEYIKAIKELNAKIEPVAIKRVGAEHDGTEESGGICSASELRRRLKAGEDVSPFIPAAAWEIYKEELRQGRTPDERLTDTALLSRLRLLNEEEFEELRDASDGLGRRVYKAVRESTGIDEAAHLAATRRYPYSRVRRLLMCAALGVKAVHAEGVPEFTRILAATDRGCEHLHKLKASDLTILTKPADARRAGDRTAELFALGANAHDVYTLTYMGTNPVKCDEDWRKSPKIVHNT